MKHFTIFLALAIAASGVPASAQESAADWVKKLGSGSYPEREKAARMLEQIGKAALPALGNAAEHADLETRRRVVIVMERIEDKLAAEWVLTATPIALRFKSKFIRVALSDAIEQMGLDAGGWKGEDYLVSIDTGPVPYWRAWKQFRTAAELKEFDWAVSAAKLRRMEGDAANMRFIKMNAERDTLIGRALRIEIPPITFSAGPAAYAEDDRSSVRVRVKWHGLEKSPGSTESKAIFAVEVRPEPRLEIVSVPRVEIMKIADAEGKMCPVQAVQWFEPQADPRDALLLSIFSGEIQFGGLLHQKAIAWQGPARPLKELHGRVRLEALVRTTLLEIPDVLKAQGKEVRGLNGITLKVLEADTGEDGRLHIRLRLANLESLAPQTDEEKIVRVRPGLVAVRGAMDVAMERLRMRDAKGWLYQANTEYKEVEKGIYEASVHFSPRPGNLRNIGLVLTKAAKTVTIDTPFQVRDVAVPAEK
jgi:hypothetical protein